MMSEVEATKESVKISEMDLISLKKYARIYGIVGYIGTGAITNEREFYITELKKLNGGYDELSSGNKSSTSSSGSEVYKGVNKCVCSVCGKAKAVRAEVYAKRVEKFGSEENLRKSYKCLECRN
jgi:hypothetical protein